MRVGPCRVNSQRAFQECAAHSPTPSFPHSFTPQRGAVTLGAWDVRSKDSSRPKDYLVVLWMWVGFPRGRKPDSNLCLTWITFYHTHLLSPFRTHTQAGYLSQTSPEKWSSD